MINGTGKVGLGGDMVVFQKEEFNLKAKPTRVISVKLKCNQRMSAG